MTHAMIVAPQPEAVEEGALILKNGGNAVDAAIGCALVQTVVDPQMCGLAGFGTMQLYLPSLNHHGFIDFHTKAPASVSENMWQDLIEGEARDGFGFFLKGRVNEIGYQSIMILEMLHILDHFDLAAMVHNGPEYIRTVAEAMKYATIDKDTKVGDPAFVDVPIDELLSKDYVVGLAQCIRRGEQANVVRLGSGEPSKDTTHICVIDADGNAVTMTHSLGMPSGVITEGLGFMYNGCMSVFDPRPGRVGSLSPGKSRFTAMAPTIVFKGEEPYIVIGAPGGTYITMGILQGILNVIDFGMNMLEAVAAPRFTANSNTIDVSNRIPRYVTHDLEQMGYPVARNYHSYPFAGVHGIRIRDGIPDGGADPGRDGMALAV